MAINVLKFVLVGTVFLKIIKIQGVDIPSFLPVCNRYDYDLNDCLKDAIAKVIPLMVQGVPELSLGPLDPYFQKDFKLEYKRNQISGRVHGKDITVYGISKSKIHDVRANILDDRLEMEVVMSNKRLFAETYARLEGKLNAFVFKTNSYEYFNISMNGLSWTCKLTGIPEVRDGKTHMKITKFRMSPEVKNIKMYVPPLFGNDKELNKRASDITNNSWELIYRELLPAIEALWSRGGLRISNKFFRKIAFDDLLPAI